MYVCMCIYVYSAKTRSSFPKVEEEPALSTFTNIVDTNNERYIYVYTYYYYVYKFSYAYFHTNFLLYYSSIATTIQPFTDVAETVTNTVKPFETVTNTVKPKAKLADVAAPVVNTVKPIDLAEVAARAVAAVERVCKYIFIKICIHEYV
jgi:hypothetical protein